MAGGDNLARRRNEDADCAVNRCSDLDLGELGLDGRRKDDLGIGDGALLDGRPGFAFGEVTFSLFKSVFSASSRSYCCLASTTFDFAMSTLCVVIGRCTRARGRQSLR